ncbi:hypothetical protein ABIE13_001010 [Ottowia thiooxydans]|uniref:Uncharacterized protein n=1 Tax=Ottowia thiooxydans TaxID=219182 RepID=A0ABV2Q5G3_9BURK
MLVKRLPPEALTRHPPWGDAASGLAKPAPRQPALGLLRSHLIFAPFRAAGDVIKLTPEALRRRPLSGTQPAAWQSQLRGSPRLACSADLLSFLALHSLHMTRSGMGKEYE